MVNSSSNFLELFEGLKEAIMEGDSEKISELQGQARALGATGRLSSMQAHVLSTLNRNNIRAYTVTSSEQ